MGGHVDREMAFSRMPNKLSSKVLSLEINNREIFLMCSQPEGERIVRVNGGTLTRGHDGEMAFSRIPDTCKFSAFRWEICNRDICLVFCLPEEASKYPGKWWYWYGYLVLFSCMCARKMIILLH